VSRFWVALFFCGITIWIIGGCAPNEAIVSKSPFESGYFDGERAQADIVRQVDLGPRIRGEKGYDAFHIMVEEAFGEAGWEVVKHEATYNGHPLTNIIASNGEEDPGDEFIIIAAHYDSRLRADRDPIPENRNLPVPGANDGASGVAVLLELARVLPRLEDKMLWFVLFDAEDNGDIDGQQWIMGSNAFVDDLEMLSGGRLPAAVVVIDMIGDADLNIHFEKKSDPMLSKSIWDLAAQAGYAEQFIPIEKYSMIDDHLPFARSGIPVALLIDFDYAHWHTVNDTPENTAAESLKAVGDTLLSWLLSR
jgi:hypothetical protein